MAGWVRAVAGGVLATERIPASCGVRAVRRWDEENLLVRGHLDVDQLFKQLHCSGHRPLGWICTPTGPSLPFHMLHAVGAGQDRCHGVATACTIASGARCVHRLAHSNREKASPARPEPSDSSRSPCLGAAAIHSRIAASGILCPQQKPRPSVAAI